MTRKVDVAIVGAGTAGLSALSEVRKATENFVLINDGAYGTTCARVGCMPSKALIQVANDYHRRHSLDKIGVHGADALSINIPKVLEYVRSLRDSFVAGVIKRVEEVGEKSIPGYAQFVEPTVLKIDNTTIHAKRVILAAGSTPFVPEAWFDFYHRIFTTDTLFELRDLPAKIGVIGMGVVGTELGQALRRLGIDITGVHRGEFIAGLTDPKVNKEAINALSEEMPLWMGPEAELKQATNELVIVSGKQMKRITMVLASMGRRPVLARVGRIEKHKALQLENLGVELDDRGLPKFDPTTMQVDDLPVFIAGDVNAERPILHEAADEGRIAGFNAMQEQPRCFVRRTPLHIVFSDPNIAVVGKSFAQLQGRDFSTGEVSFVDQGRSRIMKKNKGLLRIYADTKSGELLGAEMIAPGGEHLAHLLAWAIQQKLTALEALQMPFYHPVIEEGVRTALRELGKKTAKSRPPFELALCDESVVDSLY